MELWNAGMVLDNERLVMLRTGYGKLGHMDAYYGWFWKSSVAVAHVG